MSSDIPVCAKGQHHRRHRANHMPMIKFVTLALLSAAIVLAAPAPAQAALACTFSNPDLNFGTIDLTNNSNINTNVVMNASCTGGTGGHTINVCPNFNAGSGGVDGTGANRYMLSGATQLGFNIFRDSSHTLVWGSYTWGLAPTPPTIIVTLNGSGTGNRNQTLFGRIFSGQTSLPAGSYISSFSGSQVQMAYADSTVGDCATIGLMNLTPVSFNGLATYNSVCSVTATTLNFGSRVSLASGFNATNTIRVTCTSGVTYTVGLNGGNQGATDPTQRKLANGGNTAFVTYGIYQDSAHTLPWGDSIGTNTVSGTGTGAQQNYTSFGRVPGQTTPDPTTYTDTIVVTVTY